MKSPLSVVINTLNEEHNLPYALRSVASWVDEIVVVDMYSDDRTVEISKKFGAKVYFHERLGYADPARSFAIQQASNRWILMLDADEIVPPLLSKKIINIIEEDRFDVVEIPWLNYFFGRPLSYTGWGPNQDKHMRLFKKGAIQSTSTIHDFLKPLPSSRILTLPYEPGGAIIHFNYIDVSHFIEKLNRYTSIEADLALEKGEIISPTQALIKATRGFFRRYIRLKGYKDGWRGFYLSLLWSFYRIATYAKIEERRKVGSREDIISRYRSEAESILSGYKHQ